MARLPRGIRNRNPGNIELGADWLGLARDQDDGRFAQFSNPVFGVRAMARILRSYQRHHGLRTVREMIGRWAPAGENDSTAYAAHVAEMMGLRIDDAVDLQRDDEALAKMIVAMIRHENGPSTEAALAEMYRVPGAGPEHEGEWYPRDLILNGIALESGR